MPENKNPQDAVELMKLVFRSFCETAQKKVISRDHEDVTVNLVAGTHEGHAARLCRESDRIWIEFHSHVGSAQQPGHEIDSWCKLMLRLNSTDVTDLKLGRMFKVSFAVNIGDLVFLTARSRNLMPFVILFHSLIDQLPCYHMWETDFENSWALTIGELTPTGGAVARNAKVSIG